MLADLAMTIGPLAHIIFLNDTFYLVIDCKFKTNKPIDRRINCFLSSLFLQIDIRYFSLPKSEQHKSKIFVFHMYNVHYIRSIRFVIDIFKEL